MKIVTNSTLGWSVQKTKSKKPRPSSNIHNQLPSSNIESDQIQNRPIRGADRQRRISDRNGHDHTQGEDFMFGSIDFFINFHEYNFKTDFLKKKIRQNTKWLDKSSVRAQRTKILSPTQQRIRLV